MKTVISGKTLLSRNPKINNKRVRTDPINEKVREQINIHSIMQSNIQNIAKHLIHYAPIKTISVTLQ